MDADAYRVLAAASDPDEDLLRLAAGRVPAPAPASVLAHERTMAEVRAALASGCANNRHQIVLSAGSAAGTPNGSRYTPRTRRLTKPCGHPAVAGPDASGWAWPEATAARSAPTGRYQPPMGEAGSSSSRLSEIADQVIIELVRHAVAEERYVYPIVRAAAGGQAVVDHALTANAAAEALMRQFEPLEPTDEVFDHVLIKLMAVARSHVADEEAQLFPCLAAACLPMEMRELGEKVRAGRSVRPTRPYPSAPAVSPGSLAVGPVPGLVDRVRDALADPGARQSG